MDKPTEIEICEVKVFVSKAASDVPLPSYQSEGASGMDLHAYISEPIVIRPGEIKLIPTGIRIALPRGYEAQVRPRSGLALKHGLTIVNAPGTIDSDYRGEIKVILINLGRKDFTIESGMRIAQLVVAPVVHARLQVTDTLPETCRGEGGFGHSGI